MAVLVLRIVALVAVGLMFAVDTAAAIAADDEVTSLVAGVNATVLIAAIVAIATSL